MKKIITKQSAEQIKNSNVDTVLGNVRHNVLYCTVVKVPYWGQE